MLDETETLGRFLGLTFNNFFLPWNQVYKSQKSHKPYLDLYNHAIKFFWHQNGSQEIKKLPQNFKQRPKIRFQSFHSLLLPFSFSLSLSLSLDSVWSTSLADQSLEKWPQVISLSSTLRSTQNARWRACQVSNFCGAKSKFH